MSGIRRTPADAANAHPLMVGKGSAPRKGDVAACESCGTEFYRRPYEIRINKRFCSLPCAGKSFENRNTRRCEICGKTFFRPKSQEKHRGIGRFCSKRCRGLHMRTSQFGDNNPAWRGGVSDEKRRLRSSVAFKEWREKVFQRDNHTCQHCGQVGGYLEPDHIKPFAFFPEFRFEVSNGRTLCRPCHLKTDTHGTRARVKYGVIG